MAGNPERYNGGIHILAATKSFIFGLTAYYTGGKLFLVLEI